MKGGRPVAALVASMALWLGLVPAQARAPVSSARVGHVRIERMFAFQDGWESSCGGDTCAIVILFDLPIRTPSTTRRVDVTMTVTMDYRTGPEPDDFAVAEAGYRPRRRGDRGFRPRWRLGPSPSTQTTTLTWQKHRLPAKGRRYTFAMSVPSRDARRDDFRNFVRGRHLTVVIEMWPSGR
ncbi:MAG: hypothetical protein ACRDJ5_07750 [Actinomycetota bacterium]